MIAQRGAMLVIDTITFPMRLQNAVVSYATYIGEIFYPVSLAPLYPFPEHGVPWQSVAVSGLVLAAITALVVGLRAWRWLTVGWLWYLVALLPVIGLVQVGVQSMADRYTYLPHIGLYIMLAWTAEKLLASVPARQWLWGAALVILIPVLVESHRGPDGDLERQRDPLDQRPEGQSRYRLGGKQSRLYCRTQRTVGRGHEAGAGHAALPARRRDSAAVRRGPDQSRQRLHAQGPGA